MAQQMPMPVPVPLLFFNATRDSQSGTIYVKVVNRDTKPQPVRIAIGGVANVAPTGRTLTLSASGPNETNSITEPRKIAPVAADVDGLSANFTRTFPAYSVTVLEMSAK
jgi:alpha-N-arabinofuranosidase